MRFSPRHVTALLLAATITAILAVGATLWLLPWRQPALELHAPPDSAVCDRHGELLGYVPGADHYRCQPLPPGPLPQNLVRAVLWAEDQNFFQHPGIDPLAVLRALRGRMLGTSRSGASTISMQLVKLCNQPARRDLSTKMRETLAARRLEMEHSKEEILRAYLDRVDFGNQRRGAEAASQFYFGKAAAELSLPQAALLAILIQSPSKYNPLRHPARALKRRNSLLERMGVPPEHKLGLSRHHDLTPAGETPGTLYLDKGLQEHCMRIAREELTQLRDHHVSQAAVLILHNPSGQVLARIPAAFPESKQGGQLDGTRIRRSAGSTLKPLVYLLAFERGMYPGSILADVPTLYPDASGIEAPRNYNHRHLGPISIRQALACSQNVPAMEALNRSGGPAALLERMERFGIHPGGSAQEYGLGLAIGNAQVTLEELACAYATFAREGNRPTLLYRPASATHQDPSQPPEQPGDPVAEKRLCYMISDILSDANARAASFGRGEQLRFPFRCAVKTGTSSNYRDNWCIGYTGDYTVAVWVGNFDNSPMNAVSGISGAGPIFHRCMEALYSRQHRIPGPGAQQPAPPSPDPHTARIFGWNTSASDSATPPSEINFPHRPAGLRQAWLDSRTGFAAAAHTPRQCRQCELIREEDLAMLEHGVITPGLYDRQGRVLLDSRFSEWLSDSGLTHLYAIDPLKAVSQHPTILVPAHGSRFLLDSTLPHDGRIVELLCNLPPARTRWHAPSLPLRYENDRWLIELDEGEHTIILEDTASGQSTSSTFTVERLR